MAVPHTDLDRRDATTKALSSNDKFLAFSRLIRGGFEKEP